MPEFCDRELIIIRLLLVVRSVESDSQALLVLEFISGKLRNKNRLYAGTQVLTRSFCYVLVTGSFVHSVPPQFRNQILPCSFN